MSSRGYSFESETEDLFLQLEGKTKQDPIIDVTGKIARSFRVPTSGAMASFPGDVITANQKFPKQFMIECKARYDFTKKKGQVFRLELGWITKNEKEARKAGYVPLFALSFKRTKKNRIWFVMNLSDYNLLFSDAASAVLGPFEKKRKNLVLVKTILDQNPTTYCIETSYYLFPLSKLLGGLKQWINR